MLFGSGILGLGHHNFWIGTPGILGGTLEALFPGSLGALVTSCCHVCSMLVMIGVRRPGPYQRAKGGTLLCTSTIGPTKVWLPLNGFGEPFKGPEIGGLFSHNSPKVNFFPRESIYTGAHGPWDLLGVLTNFFGEKVFSGYTGVCGC